MYRAKTQPEDRFILRDSGFFFVPPGKCWDSNLDCTILGCNTTQFGMQVPIFCTHLSTKSNITSSQTGIFILSTVRSDVCQTRPRLSFTNFPVHYSLIILPFTSTLHTVEVTSSIVHISCMKVPSEVDVREALHDYDAGMTATA